MQLHSEINRKYVCSKNCIHIKTFNINLKINFEEKTTDISLWFDFYLARMGIIINYVVFRIVDKTGLNNSS